MPRAARVIFENACYHVMTRGNQKQKVFFEDADYAKYLRMLKKYKKRYRFYLYGYCLMPNHVHLVIDLDGPVDLAKAMQCINQSYTIYFNYKYEKIGHLWQGRFKSLIISKDQYLLNCINYIENNPVRADIVNNPLDYKWSSYKGRTQSFGDPFLDPLKL
jgi:putative transposase